MKSTIKYTALIVLACALFVSCHQEKSTKKDTDSTDPPIIAWKPCKNLEDYGEHEIPKDSAETSLKLYKDYIDSVKNCLDSNDSTPCELPGNYNIEEVLNYGSSVDFDLLLQVLMNRKLECSHKLYLMNAIRPKLDEKGDTIEGEFVTEIIFVHESTQVVQKNEDEEEKEEETIYTYYDFTQPCPNGCPKEIPGIVYPTL